MLHISEIPDAIEKAQAVSDLYLQKAMDEIKYACRIGECEKGISCKYAHFIGKT